MNELKIEDLSVGDWVQLENTPFQVMGINPPYVDLIGNGNRLRMCDIDSDNLTPIPITPEILEKNGFVRKDKYRFVNIDMLSTVEKYGNKYYDYHNIYKKGKEYRPIRVRTDNIKYVHQLQHAIRLAGIDKEIEV